MEYRNIKSTRIKKAAYINDESTMVLAFNDGREYEYYDVPKTVFNDFIYSKSPGKFFETKVKNIYEYERIK